MILLVNGVVRGQSQHAPIPETRSSRFSTGGLVIGSWFRALGLEGLSPVRFGCTVLCGFACPGPQVCGQRDDDESTLAASKMHRNLS